SRCSSTRCATLSARASSRCTRKKCTGRPPDACWRFSADGQRTPFVPAEAGTQGNGHRPLPFWVPAFAGTNGEDGGSEAGPPLQEFLEQLFAFALRQGPGRDVAGGEKGQAQMVLALQREEIHGSGNWSFSDIERGHADWIKDNKIRILL